MSNDQKVAVQGRPHAEGEVLFEQTIKGWPGSGFLTSHRTLEGVFWHSANVAQIKFTVSERTGPNGSDSDTNVASIILSEQDAITFAMAVAPKEVKQKLDLFDEVSAMLRRVEDWAVGDLPHTMENDLQALVAKINNIGKD